MKFIKTLVMIVGLTLFLPFNALASEAWHTNYNKALNVANQSKKPVYMLFVNSFSCPRCKRLKDNVTSKQEFLDFAKDNLTLLMVDYGPYYKTDKAVTFFEIEKKAEVPKEIWMKGRGPWPYLFLISPDGKVLYSGSGLVAANNPLDYLEFVKSHLK